MKKYKSRVLRTKALFLLLLFVLQIVSPTISWALASEPVQSDYMAYEEANTTDMVNLNTGDFTYNIPILDIPSPEGGFQLPLSYHAGIQLDEESSWVGLGWSLNAGAIVRNVNQFADDYENKDITTNLAATGSHGWIKNYIISQTYYDSEKGYGGTHGYGNVYQIGVGSMRSSTSVLGISAPKGKVHFDALGFASGVTEIAAIVASYGTSSFAQSAQAALTALDVALTFMQQQAEISNPSYSSSITAQWRLRSNSNFFKTTYSYTLNVSKTEKMFGSLYLNKMDDDGMIEFDAKCLMPYVHNTSPSSFNSSNYPTHMPHMFDRTKLPVSDMHMNNESVDNYAYQIEPTSIAYDNYNVMGSGISGSIKPYRMDVGSLSYPNLGEDLNRKFNLTNFIDYKVNFKYADDNANTYTNPLGDNTDNILNPQYGFYDSNDDWTSQNISSGFTCTSPVKIQTNWPNNGTTYIQDGIFPNIVVTDKTVSTEWAPGYVSTNRKEADRTGLKNNHLASSKFIQWYSNKEIRDGVAKADGFMDFLNDAQRASFRSALSLPSEGIGGFIITKENGMTYHYALPAYNNFTQQSVTSADGLAATITNGSKYAYDWLLTGITGPDFVDRGTIGVIDDADYGYWVKMDYGLFAANFRWRSPYFDKHYSPTSLNDKSVTTGIMETYYLNRISTKTHTALFVKSVKADGKSSYSTSDPFIPTPSSALKLDNVIVMTNVSYNQLITPTAQGGAGLAANYNSGGGASFLRNGDVFDNVLDNFDVSSGAVQSFLSANQIRNVKFNYSYNLCPRTYNSFDLPNGTFVPAYNFSDYGAIDFTIRKGKLTLENVTVLGPNNTSILPPFLFDYGDISTGKGNPRYNHEKWDGWGMYSSSGRYDPGAHRATENGAQWSLQKITTPDGAEISVKYERDTYASVNGNTVADGAVNGGLNTSTNTITVNDPNYTNYFKIGDKVTINASITDYVYAKVTCEEDPIHCCCKYIWDDSYRNIAPQVTITAISGNILTVSPAILTALGISSLTKPASPSSGSSYSNFSYKLSTATKFVYGGDLRVKEVAIKNENGESIKTQYIYTKDGTPNSVTSGVCSYEPEFSRSADYYFYKFFDLPATPVLYSKVTVLNNVNDNNTYLSKTEYNFASPDQNDLQFTRLMKEEGSRRREKVQDYISSPDWYFDFRTKWYHMIFRDFTSKTRSIQSIKEWNNRNQLLKEVAFKYTNNSAGDIPGNQGIYGESTILSDAAYIKNNGYDIYYRLNRTSKIKYPYILKEIDVTANGQTEITQFKDFDFMTGQPGTLVKTNPYGTRETRKTIPAYVKYSNMGSKIYDMTNKNMLSQITAAYNYVSVNGESDKLIAAVAQTWKNSWPYRELISSNYTDDTQTDVWRKYQTYSWKSDVSKDGSIPSFVDFVWSGSPNTAWQKAQEVIRYDHYSQPIESKDIKNVYSAVKKGGTDNKDIIATSDASNYQSFFHTSFEDLNNNYFAGEISLNQGVVVSSYPSYILPPYTIKPHTGKYFVRIPYSSYGPTFYVKSNLQVGKTYQASVWVNKNSSTAARLWITLDGAGQYITNSIGINDPSAITVGDWQLLKVNLTVPSTYTHSGGPSGFNDLRVFVSTIGFGNQESFIDDMRVQPVNSTVNGYVYDEKGNMTANLNNENFATIYTYDGAGRIIKVEKETAKGLKKVSETSYHYSRQ